MRHTHRFVRMISLGVLVLLIGSTVLTPLTPTARAAGLWYVSVLGSDTNDCLSPATACTSIEGALAKITPGDTINVDSGVYSLSADPFFTITKSVTLSGGWNSAFTTQTDYTTVDGQGALHGVKMYYAEVTMQRFIVQNSNTGIQVDHAILTLDHCVIRDNHDELGMAGGIYFNNSTGLYIFDTTISGNTGNSVGGIKLESGSTDVIIRNSVISDNNGYYVGAVSSTENGMTFIENSTISGNYGQGYAGGLTGRVNVYNSTITGNSSTYGSGGMNADGILYNTILAGNSSPDFPDCQGNLTSSGYNLFGDVTGCSVTLQPGDLSGVDPGLGPLVGTPSYHYLLPTSPAVDAGNPSGCLDHKGALLATDQRGLARVGRCDIGAVELQPLEYSTFEVSPKPAHQNQLLTYTATLRTGGAETLSGVTLANTLPAGLTYLPNSLQASSGAALYSGGQVTWSGDLIPATTVTVSYQARANTVAKVENMVFINSAFETVSLSAITEITPWTTYLPALTKPCPFIYFDSFTDPNSGWWTGNSSNYLVQYLPSEYQVLLKSTDYIVASFAPIDPIPDPYQISVSVRNITGVEGSYGLLFGAYENWQNFYTFEILPDQSWYVWHFDGSGWSIIASDVSNAIRTGNQFNTLTLRVNMWNDLELIINSENVARISHIFNILNLPLNVGVVATSFDTAPLDIRFNSFYIPQYTCWAQALLPAATPSSLSPGGFFNGQASRPTR